MAVVKQKMELVGSSLYYTINRISLKLFEVLSLWILIKIVPTSEVSAIGIAVGFISILNLLNIQPYRQIFKDFSRVQNRLSDYLSSYVIFWLGQALILTLLAFLAAFFYVQSGYTWTVFFVVVGLVLAFLFSNLQLILQEFFFVNLKQKRVTYANILFMMIFLATLGLLFIYPSVELYVALILAKSFVTAASFVFLAKTDLGFSFNIPADIKQIILNSIREFAVWDHFIGASLDLINKIFLFFLGLFALQHVTGEVTIALSLANLLTFFPLIIYRTSMLAITRVTTNEGLEKTLTIFSKYAFLFGVVQFAVYVGFLHYAIAFFAPDSGPDLWMHAFLIGLATTILQIGHPIHAIALLKTDVRRYFLRGILPVSVLALLGYLAVVLLQYPLGVGVVFVGAALLTVGVSYYFVHQKAGLKIQRVLLYPDEREMWGQFFIKNRKE